MNLDFSAINVLGESIALITPANRTQQPTYESHWGAPDHVFDEATVVQMTATKSDHEYNYKTEFQIWKYNKEFERQNISISQPPFDLIPIVTNTTNKNITFGIDSCWYKNSRLQANKTTDVIVETQRKI